jgi:predicted RNase H-like HicB family nuclease
MRYEIRIEKTANGYSAYVPALPGCVAAAETHEETERLIEEAIAFHREGLALEESLLAVSSFTIASANVPIWEFTNSPSLFIELKTPPLSIAALAQPRHFGTLSAPT